MGIGRGFNSCSGQPYVTTLGKLFTPVCLCHHAVSYNLVPAKGRWSSAAGEVTAGGLAESNGNLYRRVNDLRSPAGSALGPTLGIEYGKPLPFTFLRHHVLLLIPMSIPFIAAEKCETGQRIVTTEYYGLLPSINDRSSCQKGQNTY